MIRFAAAGTPGIVRDFDDPYLEMVRLLREASEIEHALLVQYLYAAFSVRDRYPAVIGTGVGDANSLIGVAIQEMHHLARVNELLGVLGAAPNLVRQDFPYEPDIYPFTLSLEPLTRASAAKYVYAEAPASALDADDPANAGPEAQQFIADVLGALGPGVRPNHIGSLYGTIIQRLDEVVADPPAGIGDLTGWRQTLEAIMEEGEGPHYVFFRKVFTGEAFGDTGVWSLDPTDDAFPSHDIGTDRSAFAGHTTPVPEEHRRTAWLSNLHYWLVLALLDLAQRTGDETGSVGFQSVRHMTSALRPLGDHLAAQGVGLPFDPLSMGYSPGHDHAGTATVLRRLALEARAVSDEVAASLPAGLPARLATLVERTVTALDDLSPVPNEHGGGGAAGGGNQPDADAAAVAMEFWFDFDQLFHFAPTPEAIAAMAGLGPMDTLVDMFTARVGEGTVGTKYADDVEPVRTSLTDLSRLQLGVFDQHFDGNEDRQRIAFEHFGQGDLFNTRRRPGEEVHMMDAGATPPVGYHRWHAIIRAMTVLGIDADRWRAIGRHSALAWAVQSEARPRQGQHNSPMAANRLAAIRTFWLARTDDEIDAAYASGPRPAPVP